MTKGKWETRGINCTPLHDQVRYPLDYLITLKWITQHKPSVQTDQQTLDVVASALRKR